MIRWRPVAGIVLCTTMLLGACSDSPDPAGTAGAPSGGASVAATGEGGVSIVVTEQRRSIDSPYPIDITVQTPSLTGASETVAKAFTDEFTARQEAVIGALLDSLDQSQPLPDPRCDAQPRGQWLVSTLTGTTQVSSVADGRASVTTLFARQAGCAQPYTAPASVSIDLASGRILGLSDVAKPDSASYRTAAQRLAGEACEDLETEPEALIGATAFTPTKDGLVLTWGNETITPSSCDVVSVTMPWNEARGEARGEQPSAPAAAAGCPAGATLPKGMDARVCGPVPKGAITPGKTLDKHYGDAAIISSPSGNLVCDIGASGAMCVAREYSFKEPAEPEANKQLDVDWIPNAMNLGGGKAQAGVSRGDASPALGASDKAIKHAALPYDKAAAIGSTVCLSQEIGMACWDTKTKHGFFIAREQYAIW